MTKKPTRAPTRWSIAPFKIDGQTLRGPDGSHLNAIHTASGDLVAFVSRLPERNGDLHPWKVWKAIAGQGQARCGELIDTHFRSTASMAALLSFPWLTGAVTSPDAPQNRRT
jgi:hypothetical protein